MSVKVKVEGHKVICKNFKEALEFSEQFIAKDGDTWKFQIYIPEAHGFKSGSNNGNYAEFAEFKIQEGRCFKRISNSGDGDMFEYPEWNEFNKNTFFKMITIARKLEEEEIKLLEKK